MLKKVFQAMPNFIMNVFLLPMEICNKLERMFNRFWWCSNRKGIKWMQWERMCKHKGVGGLGFKRL